MKNNTAVMRPRSQKGQHVPTLRGIQHNIVQGLTTTYNKSQLTETTSCPAATKSQLMCHKHPTMNSNTLQGVDTKSEKRDSTQQSIETIQAKIQRQLKGNTLK